MYSVLNNKDLDDETSLDENDRETSFNSSSAAISGSYGSTPIPAGGQSVPPLYVPYCGVVFYVMAFLGFACTLLVRECLSVAIVAMVNQTAVAEDTVITNVSGDDQCPRDPEIQRENGEFVWDRHQQGIVLAAFYYGYGVTPVFTSLFVAKKPQYGTCM